MPTSRHTVGLALVAYPLGLVLSFISYWTPWVGHRDAGLAISEVDLVEFPKFMPQYRAQELMVWRESFYVPLLVIAIALVVWSARHQITDGVSRTAGVGVVPTLRWIVRLTAIGLVFTPSIFNVLESHEFESQLHMAGIVLACIILTPVLRRVPDHLVRTFLIGAFLSGAFVPSVQLLILRPALAAIYREPIEMGLGFWTNGLGFALLCLSQLSWRPLHSARS